MTQNVNYWYNSQIRTLILHTQRLFSNFYISTGKDENGDDKLKRVPVVFMTNDKTVASIINKNTDTIIETAPKMVLTISDIHLNNDKFSGSPYYEYETEVTEKKYDDENNNYVYEPGNSYHIKRLNPVPLGVSFKLYILTTKLEQKFQLFEQIRALFTPTLELQTSENPLDWTRLTAITLTNVNYSNKGTTNLDSTALDVMDMTFEVDTNLDLPALVTRNRIIETIITDMGNVSNKDEIWGWADEDIIRTYYKPDDVTIVVKDNNIVQMTPNARVKNWNDLFKMYGIKSSNTFLHCMVNSDIDNRQEIYGEITINEKDNTQLIYNIDEDFLPKPNIDNVQAIINPHDFVPNNVENERYLIVDSIPNNTKMWGTLKDKFGNEISYIPENCIIEYKNNFWTLMLNPIDEPAEYFVRDLSDAKFLYVWNISYKCWVDFINRKYRPGFWRISQI